MAGGAAGVGEDLSEQDRALTPLRFRPPGTVLGAQDIFATINPYIVNGKHALGPGNIRGGRNRARRRPA